ncbi:MAG: hypothetical protein ACR2PB_04415 [Desulfocapsaceae bacterium]
MPNEYSVQLHDFITDKIRSADQRLADAKNKNDEKMQSYWGGQLEELSWLRAYLKAHVDLKNFVYYQ